MNTRILVLAPEPYYQERGTPIAIDRAVRVLEAEGYDIDLLTYAEGEARQYQRVRHRRIPPIPGVRDIPPGFSWKKILCSSVMIFVALGHVLSEGPCMVHAVEESCFIALLLKLLTGTPYVYDMDSSLAQQMLEKKPWLGCIGAVFCRLEGLAIRGAQGVIAVCPALADLAVRQGAKQVLLLPDVSQLQPLAPGRQLTDLRQGLADDELLLLYVGNLEQYQGIDLLLEGFTLARSRGGRVALAIVGGRAEDVVRYQALATSTGTPAVRFHGPRPLADLAGYLAQADIVVSPRIRGSNTPMKVYSFLDSGKPLLATCIESHTQVLDSSSACLVEPTAEGMAEGILRLAASVQVRERLGEAGKTLVAEHYSVAAFQRKLTEFYRRVTGTVS